MDPGQATTSDRNIPPILRPDTRDLHLPIEIRNPGSSPVCQPNQVSFGQSRLGQPPIVALHNLLADGLPQPAGYAAPHLIPEARGLRRALFRA